MKLRRKQGVECIPILDIETGSVGFGYVEIGTDNPAKVIACGRAELSAEPKQPARSLSELAAALPGLVEEVREESARAGYPTPRPTSGIVVVHAPLARTFGGHAEEVYEEPTDITPERIRAVSQSCITSMQGLDATAIFDAGLTRILINGYATRRPNGKRGVSLSATALASDMAQSVRSGIHAALDASFPGVQWKERSAVRAFASVMQKLDPDASDFVSADVGSDATTVTVFSSDGSIRHEEVPEGMRTIVARLTGTGLPEEVRSLLSMSASGTCAPAACDALASAIAKTENELIRVFGSAFEKLASSSRLPNTMALSAHPALLPSIESFFTRLDFAQFTRTTGPFEIFDLSPDHLSRAVVFDEHAPKDNGIALAAACAQVQARHDS